MRFLVVEAHAPTLPLPAHFRSFNGIPQLLIPIDVEDRRQIADRIDLLIYTKQMMPWDPVSSISFPTQLLVGDFSAGYWTLHCHSGLDRTRMPNMEGFDPYTTEPPVIELPPSNPESKWPIIPHCVWDGLLTLRTHDNYDPTTLEGISLYWSVPETVEQRFDDWTVNDFIAESGPLPPSGRDFIRW